MVKLLQKLLSPRPNTVSYIIQYRNIEIPLIHHSFKRQSIYGHSIRVIFSVPDGSKTVSTKTNISTEGAISSMAQRQVLMSSPLHRSIMQYLFLQSIRLCCIWITLGKAEQYQEWSTKQNMPIDTTTTDLRSIDIFKLIIFKPVHVLTSDKADTKPQDMNEFIKETVKVHNEKRRKHGVIQWTAN